MRAWILLAPVLVMLVVACGREPSLKDQNQAALQRVYNAQNTMLENAKTQATRANELAKANADKRKAEVRDKVDDRYRHGKVVLAGPMIKTDDNKVSDPVGDDYKGVMPVRLNHGHVGSRDVEDSTSPGRGRKYFSRSLTDIGRRYMQKMSSRRDRIVSIGCRKNELIDEGGPTTTEVDLAADVQSPASSASSEGPVLKRINAGLSEKIRAEDIRETNDVEVVADTVIACRSYSAAITIVARRLILSNFVVSLAGQSSDVKSFMGFAEELYLDGSNSITATSSCGMIWLEVVRGFSNRVDRTSDPFNKGRLEITVQGPSSNR